MLTNMQAREARPRPTRYEVTCDVLPGFILRVHPAGKKVFYARSRNAAGKDRRHRIGRMVPGFGADDARREAQVILALRHAEARAGEPVRGARPPAKPYTRPTDLEPPTLRELARRFEHEHISVKLQPASAAKYRSTLRLHILPPLGDRRLVDITTAAVQRLHDDLKATPSTANYVRSVLNVMYARAEQWELTTFNPVTAIRRFTERAPTRVISPEERQRLDRVLTSAEHIASGHTGHIGREAIWALRLLALTGMLLNEVRDLRWEQVDWRRSMLRLSDSKTYDVVVSNEVIDLLRKIAAAKGQPRRGLVICSRGGKHLSSLWRSWAAPARSPASPTCGSRSLRHGADRAASAPTMHAESTAAPETCAYRIATPVGAPAEKAANARHFGDDTAPPEHVHRSTHTLQGTHETRSRG